MNVEQTSSKNLQNENDPQKMTMTDNCEENI